MFQHFISVNSWSSGFDEAVFLFAFISVCWKPWVCWISADLFAAGARVSEMWSVCSLSLWDALSVSLCFSLRQIAVSLEDSCSVLKRSVLLYTPSASMARETHRETESRNKTIWEKTFNHSMVMSCLKQRVMKCKGLTFIGFIFRQESSECFIMVKLNDCFHRPSHWQKTSFCVWYKEKQRRGDKASKERRWDPSSSWFLRLACRWLGCLWKYQVKLN